GGPGDSGKAISDYSTALSLDVSYEPKPYLNRGIAYKNTGKVQLAITDFEKAIKLSQNKPEYAEIKTEASAQLLKILPPKSTNYYGLPTQPLANLTIYLHYQDPNDVDTLKKIAAALRTQPDYKVAVGFQRVTQVTTGDVRYFHQEDEAKAAKIKKIVEDTLRVNRIEKTLELKPLLRLGMVRDIPQGWIEVWLPPLPEPSLNIRRPAVRSPYQDGPKPQSQLQMPYSKNKRQD